MKGIEPNFLLLSNAQPRLKIQEANKIVFAWQ